MRRVALLMAVTAALLLLPAAAVAAPGIQFGIQDDTWLQTGSLQNRLNTLDRLGPDVVRYTLRWDQVARRRPKRATNPNDKAYNWSQADALLRGLRKHKIGVLVTLYGTPRWANGGNSPNVAPLSKSTLSSFAVAAAKRYPWITRWEVWNEPNLLTFLRPNSPSVYVTRLLNPTYNALHGVRRGIRVAGGVTSPRQTPTGMAPIRFMRGMAAAHARLDVYSHHPYPVSRLETPSRANCRYCDGILPLARLRVLLAEVKRDFGPKRVWLTEYGYQTDPPDPYLGVSWANQALYLAQAAYLAYRAPQVDLLIQFLVRDESKSGRWQSGLTTVRGRQKPSFKAFGVPLVQLSHKGTRTVLWGQIRPGSGRQRYRLQRQVGGTWRNVPGPQWTSPRGYFQRVVEADAGARFRILAIGDRISSLSLKVH